MPALPFAAARFRPHCAAVAFAHAHACDLHIAHQLKHTQHACWMLSSRVIRQCQVLKRIQRHRQTQHRCNHLTHIPSHCHTRLTLVTSVRQRERVQRAVVCRERDASRACTGSHQSHTAHACTRVTTAVSNVERRERKRCWHGRLDKCDAKVLVQWLGGRRARTHRHHPAQRHA